MIQAYIDAWMEHKDEYKGWLRTLTHNWEDELTYKKMVQGLVNIIINPYIDELETLDADLMTVIDNGDYQGTEIFIIPEDTYQPSIDEYVYTYVAYGSCSGCDTLLNALSLSELGANFSKDTIDALMTLALHLMERFATLQ